MPSPGALLCLASAAAFGAMGIFGKLAYERGRDRRHAARGALRARRRAALAVRGRLAAAPATCARCRAATSASRSRSAPSATALRRAATSRRCERLDASLLSLLVYTFPAIVAVAAIALGRERASRRTAVALALASAGLVLVLAGAAAGALDPLGTALGLAAAVVYSAYILSSEGVAGARRPARAEHAGLHRRGRDPDARRARRRRPRPRRRERGRATAGWPASRSSRRSAPSASSSPGCGAWARPPRRSCRPSSRWSPSCWRSSCSASRSARAARRRGARAAGRARGPGPVRIAVAPSGTPV